MSHCKSMENKKYERLLRKVSLNIKKARNAKGLTQEDMQKFGFNYRFYQKVESGKYSFNLFTLYRIASAFKVDLKDFFS